MAPTIHVQLAAVRAELSEQRRIVQEQQVELRSQRRQLELVFRRTADLQAEVDVMKATASLAGFVQPDQGRRGQGNGRVSADRPKAETIPSLGRPR